MPIQLFNTLSGRIEPLAAHNGRPLGMYACGPTVYDYGHIGNFRTFLHVDLLRRVLLQQGEKLLHVMNITDVDDKIIRNAAAAGLSIEEFTRKYERAFLEDLDALQVQSPEVLPHATEYIPEMVDLIEGLVTRDIAYRTDDGSYYFRIAGFPEYGKLSKKDLAGITDGARVDVDEYDKDSARDFALWKAPKPGEYNWDTPLGPGRPGWHIECSAMAMRFLGETLDLHAGGEDLMFPHHENEIAQSESVTGKPFARHWMHVRFLLVEGKKMSKSEGNFYTLRDLLLKGHKASAIRFLLLSVPYRHQLNFTFDGLAEATSAVERLRNFAARMREGKFPPGADSALSEATANHLAAFHAALDHDLNTAEARGEIFELVRAANSAADNGTLGAENAAQILRALAEFDQIFAVIADHDAEATNAAIAWADAEGRVDEVAPELLAAQGLTDSQIDALVSEREQARKNRNFARADAIRGELAGRGVILEDSKGGVRWKRK
ncbi:MAG TPA: cysteine--tRNA ligase [Acidobacteriaceae bacterium]|jgi:cysteinyl-tRNA synthetase|nr:cysteine--tRNA ligase [Acidobacteriaceae bacterium]